MGSPPCAAAHSSDPAFVPPAKLRSRAPRTNHRGPAENVELSPTAAGDTARSEGRALLSAATVLGIGMGAFVDGIVFHQLLQVHSMLSAQLDRRTVVNLEITMFWDGVFHAFAWATTLTGIALLFRALSRAQASWSAGILWAG